MKAQLFAVVLAAVYLSVHGVPAKAKYTDCGSCEGEYTVTEAVLDPVTEAEEIVGTTERNVEENLQQDTQTETVEDNVTEASNVDETVTEKDEPVVPEVAPEDTPTETPIEVPTEAPVEAPVEEPAEAKVEESVVPVEAALAPTTAQPKTEVVNRPVVKKTKKNRPSFNFFPVVFGGTGISGARSDGFPTGTVAVANSFSTGRNSVAVSAANAGPADSFRHLYRNQNSRYTHY